MGPETSPTDTGAASPDRGASRRTWILRGLGIAVFVGFGLMWAWIFANQDRYEPAGRLEDRAFPTAAEPICATAVEGIDALPPSREARTAVERAATVEEATRYLVTMQAQLREVVGGGEEARWIRQWIDDWSAVIADRFDYAARLREDETAEYLVTEKYGSQITRSMDNFAEVNDMPSCVVPGDV